MRQAWSDGGGPRDRAYRAYCRRCKRTGEVYREPGNIGIVTSDPPVVIVSNRYDVLARYEILPSGRLREVTS